MKVTVIETQGWLVSSWVDQVKVTVIEELQGWLVSSWVDQVKDTVIEEQGRLVSSWVG